MCASGVQYVKICVQVASIPKLQQIKNGVQDTTNISKHKHFYRSCIRTTNTFFLHPIQ